MIKDLLSVQVKHMWLLALAVLPAWVFGANPPNYRGAADGKYAIESGDFHSAIWVRQDANGKFPKRATRDLPKEDEQACIGKNEVTVTISKPVKIISWLHRANKATTVWKKGAEMETITFYGVRGKGSVGTFSMVDGSLKVTGGMMLAGQTSVDSATGVFEQTGGSVTLTNFPLALTGDNPLSCSTGAIGIYNLSGGSLNIISERSKPGRTGIVNGLGKGTFNWTGGVLNARRLSGDLVNKGGRLSPGGEGVIGETALDSDVPVTYTQEKDAELSIDIAGGSKYDTVLWMDKTGNSEFVLEDGANIRVNLLNRYKPTSGKGFNVVSADKIRVSGNVGFSGDNAGDFSYEVIERKGKQVLRLEYTPGKGGGALQ